MTTYIIKMRVDLRNILKQADMELKTPVISMIFQILLRCLQRITTEAIKIDDPRIIEELDTLGLIKWEEGEYEKFKEKYKDQDFIKEKRKED